MAKVCMLKIDFESNGFRNTVYPTIITDSVHMVLIDCGYPGFIPYLEGALESRGYSLDRLTHIIITHHDFDHMGSLKALKERYPHVKVLASTIEAPFIEGKSKSLRLVQAEAIYPKLPEEAKPAALVFQSMLAEVSPCEVNQPLSDGDILPICGGIKVVATPGHMPGHIALYHIGSKTVVVGDAMVIENNKLSIANPQYTLNMPEAIKSIKKIAALELKSLICYHGGCCEINPNEAIQLALLE